MVFNDDINNFLRGILQDNIDNVDHCVSYIDGRWCDLHATPSSSTTQEIPREKIKKLVMLLIIERFLYLCPVQPMK